MNEFLKRARDRVWLEGDPERDRSAGLAVFGALEIIMGLMAFAFAMFLLVLVSAIGIGGMKISHCWITMGFLLYMSGWFFVMGFGSIKALRWARALMLVGSWVTVFFGTLVLALPFRRDRACHGRCVPVSVLPDHRPQAGHAADGACARNRGRAQFLVPR